MAQFFHSQGTGIILAFFAAVELNVNIYGSCFYVDLKPSFASCSYLWSIFCFLPLLSVWIFLFVFIIIFSIFFSLILSVLFMVILSSISISFHVDLMFLHNITSLATYHGFSFPATKHQLLIIGCGTVKSCKVRNQAYFSCPNLLCHCLRNLQL